MADSTKKWYESSGFFVGLIALFGSLWGFTEGQAAGVVTAVTGLITAGATVWHFFKSSKFRGWKEWLSDGNTWVYIAGTLGLFLPNAGELIPALQGVVDGIISKNFGAIISGLFALGVMIYKIVTGKKTAAKA